jgi:hypothetical protein
MTQHMEHLSGQPYTEPEGHNLKRINKIEPRARLFLSPKFDILTKNVHHREGWTLNGNSLCLGNQQDDVWNRSKLAR